MDNQLKASKIIGIIFIIFLGTLMHFVYEWSNYNTIVALVAPINESIWEHLKLLFFPTLLYSIIEYNRVGKNYSNYITSIAFGLIIGLLSIIVIYYTYTGIIGYNIFIMDILIFIVSVILTQYISYYVLTNNLFTQVSSTTSILLLIVILLMFILFTFKPPMIELFRDPVNSTYGIVTK
ncbi:MAG: DUF6512 family protein [Lachnotalea sp.]